MREQAYNDNKLYQSLNLIITNTNKSLQAKQSYLKKKWYHLKTSNLGEKEYRIKEKALQHAEVEEMNEIKEDLFKRLCSQGLPGFQTKEDLLQEKIDSLGNLADPAKRYEVEERSYLLYNKNQMNLLEKVLAMDFSNQPKANLRMDMDLMVKKKPGNFPNLARREKKVSVVKLSKQISKQLEDFRKEEGSQNDLSGLTELKPSDFYSISSSEIDKINSVRSDKSYYDELDIEGSFNNSKNFLCDLIASNNFKIEKLEDEKIGKLVDAVSFSLNGVHYYQKFKKTKSMIHPLDILYTLSKFS